MSSLRNCIVENPEENLLENSVRNYIVENPEESMMETSVRNCMVESLEEVVKESVVENSVRMTRWCICYSFVCPRAWWHALL